MDDEHLDYRFHNVDVLESQLDVWFLFEVFDYGNWELMVCLADGQQFEDHD